MSSNETKKLFNELLAKAESTEWRKKIEFRQENKSWLKKSARIAIKINKALSEQKITQKLLAEKLEVSPQMVNKILKGSENLTLETISKLESALNIDLITILKSNETVVTIPEKGFIMTKGNVVSKVYSSLSGLRYEEVISSACEVEENKYSMVS